MKYAFNYNSFNKEQLRKNVFFNFKNVTGKLFILLVLVIINRGATWAQSRNINIAKI